MSWERLALEKFRDVIMICIEDNVKLLDFVTKRIIFCGR